LRQAFCRQRLCARVPTSGDARHLFGQLAELRADLFGPQPALLCLDEQHDLVEGRRDFVVPLSREVLVRTIGLLVRVVVLAAGAVGCSNRGPCDGAVPPPDMSQPIVVSSTVACAIAVQKELAGGLAWTPSGAASVGPAGALSMADVDGGSTASFTISQNGFAANIECTSACGYSYNQCFLPTDYLESYVGAK
jgi:hypothetical protein